MSSLNPFQKTIFLSLTVYLLLLSCILIPPADDIPRPKFLPIPADIGTPIGGSPMSGDWSAPTDFGKLAFTVDPNGTLVTTMYLKMDSLSCAGTTFTGAHQSQDAIPPWTITDGEFRVTLELGYSNDSHLHIRGTYDETGNKFSGDWRFVVYNGNCTGTWETASRN